MVFGYYCIVKQLSLEGNAVVVGEIVADPRRVALRVGGIFVGRGIVGIKVLGL